MSAFEIISDYSKANLKVIPDAILDMSNLKMLFLERNFLVSLPENFFYRLPNLMWLDLRNNQLEALPKSIAHHEHLEHLLLTNNNITKLPNELGLATNLKALQVAENPLAYPSKKVVQEGTKSIKTFLKEQYEIECAKNAENHSDASAELEKLKMQLKEKEKFMEAQEEKLLKIHEKESEIAPMKQSGKVSKDAFYSAHKLSKQTLKSAETIQNNIPDPSGLNPNLRVKKLEYGPKKAEEPMKIIHSVSKSDSKISLKSYFQKPGARSNLERIPENVLKEGWLNKLRILLNDQERILQQERNLRALSSWRQKPPKTPKTFYDSDDASRLSEAPYATYPEYARIPSRSDLASQLQSFLQDSNVANKRPIKTPHINLDKVINDLVEQLREMEISGNNNRSPRSEMQQSGKQIQTIIDIHKKLLQLKSTNDYMI
uniref:Leucine-rich repeat-containing protein 27 n=2 Tax=Dendroctonus ponderosae TaxID=77166 RepID=A0AAR5PNC2_DENPD